MNASIKKDIELLPHKSGVYLMHDSLNRIIYVGKAIDLYKRVSQYFLRPQYGKVEAMVNHVDHFTYIITSNEKEAFILEMNLIQKYYPRYNILLKDDSHYPYIALKRGNDPTLKIKRDNKEKGYIYYGPFPNSSAAYQMVDLLGKLFPIRKCKNIPSTPCLYYHLGQCLGPCINKVNEEELLKLSNQISSFLEGNNSSIKNNIEKKLKEASDNLEFEKAGEYASILKAIDHINIKQTVEAIGVKSSDIFAYSTREEYLSISVLIYRNGTLLGKNVFISERFGDLQEQIVDLIFQYYQKHELPNEIIINDKNIKDDLSDILDTHINYVTRGKFLELIVTAKENASNGLDEYFMTARLDDNKLALLESLGKLLNIPTPLHIELFDNSHIQGSNAVGAMVAFVNGERCTKLYRKFNINSEVTKDDYNSMKEVITRHYLRSKEENKKLPDLILVDGGLGQVHSAIEALNNINVDIKVFGLYKGIGHKTSGIIDKDGKEYPIENKALFFLLTRMQDEVHRFAISFHKQKRNSKMTESILDNIKGLGDKRKEILFRAYTDINSLKNASLDELGQLLPDDVAKEVYDKFHN